jgi:excisionase family DNA binding protein
MDGATSLLRIEEVARTLRVSRAQAYRLVRRGEIPCVRIGASVRVRAATLDEWLRRKEGEAV